MITSLDAALLRDEPGCMPSAPPNPPPMK